MSTLEDDAIGRNIDGFDKLGASQFQSASGCSILGVTSDPEGGET